MRKFMNVNALMSEAKMSAIRSNPTQTATTKEKFVQVLKNKLARCLACKVFLIVSQFTSVAAHAQSAPFTTLVQATGAVTAVSGFIVGVNLVNGGAGYAGVPLVSVVDSSGSNAVIAAAISSDGVVTNLIINNAGSHYSVGAALVIAPPPTNASQSDININIGRYLTDNIRTWTAGTNYPFGGFYTNYAGITFYLAAYPGITNGLGIVLTGVGTVTAPKTNNFPVNVTNAVTVYTLMNSEYGQLGKTNGTLEFYGSQGAHASFDLVQGFNLRDHYNGSFQNTISSNLMRHYWGPTKSVRLDCQGWMLPTNFYSQTLTNIQVRSFGNNPNGIPTITAITIRTSGLAIAVEQSDNEIICSWPSTPTNYVLQTATSLNNPTWLTATNSPPLLSNQFVVTNLVITANQFYRLMALP